MDDLIDRVQEVTSVKVDNYILLETSELKKTSQKKNQEYLKIIAMKKLKCFLKAY